MRLTYILFSFLLFAFAGESKGAVLVKDSLWPQDKTLNVLFLDGSFEQIEIVKKIAPQWVEGIRLEFAFFDSISTAPKETHIRISFKAETGSMLGDHGEYLARTPTLLLSELNQYDLTNELAQRYILHEFGHALGFEHEFLNPAWPYGSEAIQIQVQKCIPRLVAMQYLIADAEKRCNELNAPLTRENSYSTVYDIHSIMNYPQSITLKDQSKIVISAKTKLSALDILAMERWYGKSK